jgi:5-(carboxyamino)imidazole ribonucleotide mutase
MKKQIRRPKVAIVMGSQTDYKILQEAQFCLQEFGIVPLVQIISAHRTPEKMYEFATSAADNGIVVVIAGAGGAAHLPGMIAALTTVPVIGVPVTVGKLKGLDALLSIAQMPKGVPVASVAIDNAWNAGLLAVQILAMASPDGKEKVILQKKLLTFKKAQKAKVKKMNISLKRQLKIY